MHLEMTIRLLRACLQGGMVFANRFPEIIVAQALV